VPSPETHVEAQPVAVELDARIQITDADDQVVETVDH
jgi:hypothetical protein